MASVITKQEIEELRRAALAAKPYDEDSDEMNTFDGDWTQEQTARKMATLARLALQQDGIPLEK